MKQRELVRALLHKATQDEAAMARLMPDTDLDDEAANGQTLYASQTRQTIRQISIAS